MVLFQQPFTALDRIEGMVVNLAPGGLSFDLYDPAATTTECVTVDPAATLFLITTDSTSYTSTEITGADLVETQNLQVYGDFAPSGCFSALTILASPL